MISIRIEPTFEAWRTEARLLLENRVAPEEILWSDTRSPHEDLFQEEEAARYTVSSEKSSISLPRSFFDLAKTVACHRAPERWALLYRIAWRMVHQGERHLLSLSTDDDARAVLDMQKAIRRDCHKMNAFVRFRKVGEDSDTGRERFVAWFEPSHYIIEYNAPFFVKRFTGMDWSILSPDASIHWDGTELHVTEGVSRDAAPTGDELESLWLKYYKSIFNPARLKLQAMQAEMPKKYWKNLPEASLIEELSRDSGNRVDGMITREPLPPKPAPENLYLKGLHDRNEDGSGRRGFHTLTEDPEISLDELASAAAGCRACPLWENATQTVFGQGVPDADIMVIGEQPGDEEDIQGVPFAGPAGKLLNRALQEAGIDRDDLYITNAVKHFKWKPSTNRKKRLHDKANRGEVRACRPWLIGEVFRVSPRVIITLGNTAAQSVIDESFKILSQRGPVKEAPNLIDFSGKIVATVHPSYILRLRDEEAKASEFDRFVSELSGARELLK